MIGYTRCTEPKTEPRAQQQEREQKTAVLKKDNRLRIDLSAFNKATEAFSDRVDRFYNVAASFDEKQILESLAPNKLNGFSYRFDERIADGKTLSSEVRVAEQRNIAPLAAYEFDESISLAPSKRRKQFEFSASGVRFNAFDQLPKYPLESATALSIDPDELGEIAVRVRASGPARLFFGWCKTEMAFAQSREIRKGYGYISIEIEPTETFRVYRIPTTSILNNRQHIKPDDKIRKIYFWAAKLDERPSQVEVDYLRFLSKKHKYSRATVGTDYETLGLQTRPVLFTNTPVDLSYSMALPDVDGLVLSVGLGILQQDHPVRFRIKLTHDGQVHWLLDKTVETGEKWFDTSCDLSSWRDKSVKIHFLAHSTNNSVAFWSNPIVAQSPPHRFNVLILLEDALRADHLSCYGYQRHQTTPIKDALFADGVLFSRAVSQATKTRASAASFMTSLYPTATGVWRDEDFLNDDYLTLAEVMRSQGFATASFVQNANAGPGNGLHQGFDTLNDYLSIGTRANSVYSKELFDFLKKGRRRNFMAYIHLLDPHGVYEPPAPFDAYFKRDHGSDPVKRHRLLDPDWIKTPTATGRINRYDGEIRYNDAQFDRLLGKLKEYSLFENTLIVFMSDHGEYEGEHQLWGHHPPGYIQGLHVPLLMYYPKKLPRKQTINQTVQLLDLMPTILELAGVDTKTLPLQGDSLIRLIKGRQLSYWNDRLNVSDEIVQRVPKSAKDARGSVFFRDVHLLTSILKIKGIPKSKKATIGLDLALDKDEESPVVLNNNDALYKTIRRFLERYQSRNIKAAKQLTDDHAGPLTVDPSQQAQLKALGYLD
jgi:arylsulfatase